MLGIDFSNRELRKWLAGHSFALALRSATRFTSLRADWLPSQPSFNDIQESGTRSSAAPPKFVGRRWTSPLQPVASIGQSSVGG